MHDIRLSPRIAQPPRQPCDDTTSFHDLTKQHCTGLAGKPVLPALEAQGLVEAGCEELYPFTHGVLRRLLRDFV